ncbi:MAG: hypothetical protein WKG06_38540 [Segetibacter sp.]
MAAQLITSGWQNMGEEYRLKYICNSNGLHILAVKKNTAKAGRRNAISHTSPTRGPLAVIVTDIAKE